METGVVGLLYEAYEQWVLLQLKANLQRVGRLYPNQGKASLGIFDSNPKLQKASTRTKGEPQPECVQ